NYLTNMQTDDEAFTAILIGIAVKGWITITDDGTGAYVLTKTSAGREPLTGDETAVFDILLSTGTSVVVAKENGPLFQDAKRALSGWLDAHSGHGYFARHSGFLVPAVVCIIAGGMAFIYAGLPLK